jgi:hypothetical protein
LLLKTDTFLDVEFNCENDPTTGNRVNYQFAATDFTQVTGEASLDMFKLSAINLPELT